MNIALMMYMEIDIICMILLFVIGIKSLRNIHNRECWRFFQGSVAFLAVYVGMDMLWEIMEYDVIPFYAPMAYAVNDLYFVFGVLAATSWFFYTEAELGSTIHKSRKAMWLSSIPTILMVMLLAVSHFNGILFSFDKDGRYIRGPLNLLSFIIPLGCLLVASIHATIKARKKENYAEHGNYMVRASFGVIITIISLIQIALPGTPLPCIGICFAVLLAYINNQEMMISQDPLTRLYNRYQLVRYLTFKMEHPNPDKSLFLMVMDVDKFKQINDNFGHVEGDMALMRLSRILYDAAGEYGALAARYGGDEFVIVIETAYESDVQSLCRCIYERLDDDNKANADSGYLIKVSIGYAMHDGKIKYVPDFIKIADEALYRVKKTRANSVVILPKAPKSL